mmetsp:Transcript_10634/g.21583  ORF Transcript_10634/g.21583 Transcript_10634/m.21583 type:complete len:210 (-) Transcript_10634:525-1154(-)
MRRAWATGRKVEVGLDHLRILRQPLRGSGASYDRSWSRSSASSLSPRCCAPSSATSWRSCSSFSGSSSLLASRRPTPRRQMSQPLPNVPPRSATQMLARHHRQRRFHPHHLEANHILGRRCTFCPQSRGLLPPPTPPLLPPRPTLPVSPTLPLACAPSKRRSSSSSHSSIHSGKHIFTRTLRCASCCSRAFPSASRCRRETAIFSATYP